MLQDENQTLDLLLFPTWIVPVNPHGIILKDYAIGFKKDKISLITSKKNALKYKSKKVTQLPNMLISPGLINSHGHAAMTLFRGLADDLTLINWLQKCIWPNEAMFVNKNFIFDGTALAIAEQIKSGITCFADMYFFPESICQVIHNTGIRAQIFVPILDCKTPDAINSDDSINKTLLLFNRYKNHSLISIGLGPHSTYTVNDSTLKKIKNISQNLNINIQMHVNETSNEIEEYLKKYNTRPLIKLYHLGLLNKRFQAVHMTQINENEVEILSKTNTSVIHCPESNMKLASGFCQVEKLWQAGINVAIGTDSAASNNDLDLIGETRTAALLAKAISGNATALNAYNALRMATFNGALALGLEKIIGSLEIGKKADLVAFDMSGLPQQPIYDPISQLIYTSNRNCVRHVWINGEHVLNNFELINQNESRLINIAQQWQSLISKKK